VTTIKPPGLSKPSPVAAHTPKTFSVKTWTDAHEGVKSLMYAGSGMGKTTQGTMAPNPIFIGIDDGARKIKNPKTGLPVQAVEGIETFLDLRDALHQTNLFPEGSTIVLDTITRAENLGQQDTFARVKDDKGATVSSIEAYGYGKGYVHLLDTMRLLISDLEPHVRRGVHVLLLAQQGNIRVANPEGTDYIKEAPKLAHTNNASVVGEFVEWCDNVFRIGYSNLVVTKANDKATKGKVSGSAERAVFTTGELHFIAKNRSNGTLPPVIGFTEPADDSLWQFVFGGSHRPMKSPIHAIEVERYSDTAAGEFYWIASAFEPFPSRRDGIYAHDDDRLTAVGKLVEFGLAKGFEFSNNVTVSTKPRAAWPL
jgi:hypothetical protein